MILSEAAEVRFRAKVSTPDANGCMIWTGAIQSQGYGSLKADGRYLRAHRVSLELAEGPPPASRMEAAHQPLICHRRECVSPAHLRWATRGENKDDELIDGTRNRGERHGMSKLTNAEVDEIRSSRGIKQKDLAERYGVSVATISLIVRNKSRRHG